VVFLGSKKARKIWLFLAYFQSDWLGSGKTLSELHIHYKSLATSMQGAQNIGKILLLPQK